jgi:hypothetical protein
MTSRSGHLLIALAGALLGMSGSGYAPGPDEAMYAEAFGASSLDRAELTDEQLDLEVVRAIEERRGSAEQSVQVKVSPGWLCDTLSKLPLLGTLCDSYQSQILEDISTASEEAIQRHVEELVHATSEELGEMRDRLFEEVLPEVIAPIREATRGPIQDPSSLSAAEEGASP